jgi:hypothetical protein
MTFFPFRKQLIADPQLFLRPHDEQRAHLQWAA